MHGYAFKKISFILLSLSFISFQCFANCMSCHEGATMQSNAALSQNSKSKQLLRKHIAAATHKQKNAL